MVVCRHSRSNVGRQEGRQRWRRQVWVEAGDGMRTLVEPANKKWLGQVRSGRWSVAPSVCSEGPSDDPDPDADPGSTGCWSGKGGTRGEAREPEGEMTSEEESQWERKQSNNAQAVGFGVVPDEKPASFAGVGAGARAQGVTIAKIEKWRLGRGGGTEASSPRRRG
jgi:hypothetical protein